MTRIQGVDRAASILIVDDSPAILALLKDLLAAQGFKDVRTAESVEGGLTLLAERSPDIIFLDLMMPESSGIEFERAALEASPRSRIVVTTALPPHHEAVTMAVSQGAADYLQKPLRDDALAAVLRHVAPSTPSPRDEDYGYL